MNISDEGNVSNVDFGMFSFSNLDLCDTDKNIYTISEPNTRRLIISTRRLRKIISVCALSHQLQLYACLSVPHNASQFPTRLHFRCMIHFPMTCYAFEILPSSIYLSHPPSLQHLRSAKDMEIKMAVVEKNPSSPPSKQNISPFLRLPRELRDLIYCDALAAGSLGILTVSKVVHQEASELVSKHAVLRINLGFANRTNWSQLGSGSVASVQHLDLRINAGPEHSDFYTDVISGLTGNLIIRKSCIICLNYRGRSDAGWVNAWHNLLHLDFALLNGFKRLAFKIVVNRCQYAHFQRIIAVEEYDEAFPFDSLLTLRHRELYMNLRRYMERHFGPATFNDRVEGHCLTFHPLGAIPEGWSPEWKEEPLDYYAGYRTW